MVMQKEEIRWLEFRNFDLIMIEFTSYSRFQRCFWEQNNFQLINNV